MKRMYFTNNDCFRSHHSSDLHTCCIRMLCCCPNCPFFSLSHCVLHPGRLQSGYPTGVCQEMCKPAESQDRSDLHICRILQSIWRRKRTLFSIFCRAPRPGPLHKGELPQVRSRKCASQQE